MNFTPQKIKNLILGLSLILFISLGGNYYLLHYNYIHSCFYLNSKSNEDLIKLYNEKNEDTFFLIDSISECYNKQYTPFLLQALKGTFFIRPWGSKSPIYIGEKANNALNLLYNKNYRLSNQEQKDKSETQNTIKTWDTLYKNGELTSD